MNMIIILVGFENTAAASSNNENYFSMWKKLT